MRRRATVLLLAADALLAAAAPAHPAPTTEPVDVTSEGAPSPGESGRPVISGDGRWVVFSSGARLAPDDTSDAVDVYVRDLVQDETTLVTPAPDERDRLNYDPAISDDGRFVAFTSQGRGLLPEDANVEEDVYLKDLATGELTVASARANGGRAAGGRYAALSGNGRWIAFVSDELVRGDRNGDWDLYVRNVATGRLELVSRDNRGRQTRGAFDDVDLSYDGSRVAYVLNGEIYVYDRGSERRVRADVNSRERPAEHPWPFGNVSLSANGRAVAFASTAGNLSALDENGRPDVYVRDLRAGTTELVSVDPSGRAPSGDEDDSWSVSISRSGRFVAFGSDAALTEGDTDAAYDAFVRDRLEDLTLPVTEECAGSAGHPSLSNDARWVTFASTDCGSPGATLFARGPLMEP